MLIAAIFMKQLPLEFSSILSKLLPAITGGANLMLMGVYSYLSEMTKEEDRTFRYCNTHTHTLIDFYVLMFWILKSLV